MKIAKLILLLSITASIASAQTSATKSILKKIEGEWTLDQQGNVTYTHVVNEKGLSKDKIYHRVHNFLTYTYNGGRSNIQTQDSKLGRLVAKGVFDDIYVGMNLVETHVDAWHTVIVDIKEEKARVTVLLSEYDIESIRENAPASFVTTKVAQEYPVNNRGRRKNEMGKAFARSHAEVQSILAKLESAIKEGYVNADLENEDW